MEEDLQFEVPAGGEVDKAAGRRRPQASVAEAPLYRRDVSANSDFPRPEFWISGQMVDLTVKPIYRHQFYTSFPAK